MKPIRPDPLDRVAAVESAARDHHYEGERATRSFWQDAAASLPPHVRRRHGHLFEAAERWDPVLDFLLDRAADLGRAIGKVFGAPKRSEHSRRRTFREIGRA